MWKQYRSHKIVKAAPIFGIANKLTGRIIILENNEIFVPDVVAMIEKAFVGDYAVEYEDGYKSISPKAAFESGYTEIGYWVENPDAKGEKLLG